MRRTGETKKTPWGKMEDKKSEEAKLKASGVDKEGVDGFVKGLREDEANVMDNLNNLFREDGKKDSGQA